MSTAALVLSTALFAVAPTADDPILAAVKERVKDHDKPFTMLVMLHVKPDMRQQFETAFVAAIKETRKEKGNLRYDLNRASEEEGLYALYERWENMKALEVHLAAEHIKKLLTAIGPMLDGEPRVNIGIPVGD
jgi:quinol monooxygenase YgiN